jgi:hypothetical protein
MPNGADGHFFRADGHFKGPVNVKSGSPVFWQRLDTETSRGERKRRIRIVTEALIFSGLNTPEHAQTEGALLCRSVILFGPLNVSS